MDQYKIGKLIAKLRKEKGLTQRELGDKVGVGFKAVSKWERGITCPDISIINELSKILGITSDELLTGELKTEHKTINNKSNNIFSKKIIILITLIVVIGLSIFVVYKTINNRTEVYDLTSDVDKYYVDGKITFEKNNMYININKLVFKDKDLYKTIIKNYRYQINCNEKTILIYGYLTDINEISSLVSIKDVVDNFSVDYQNDITIDKKELINNGLILSITFIDDNNNTIQQEIMLDLSKK